MTKQVIQEEIEEIEVPAAINLDKAFAKTHPIQGPDAEDIRSTNRGLLKFRLELAESPILVDAHYKKVEELKGQADSLLTEIAKESLKLQKLVDGAFAKSKLDIKDGWRFDGENVQFFRE